MTQAPPQPATTTRTRVLGEPLNRVDGHAKTTGAAQFSAEYPYANLAYAAIVHSTIPRGRVTAIDTKAALDIPGVLAVITHENAPRMKPPPKQSFVNLSSLATGTSVNYLNTDEVHWNGQPIAVTVADSLDAAREAARNVHVTYDTQPATVDFASEEPNATPQKGNMLIPSEGSKGDAPGALAAAEVSVDLRFTTPMHIHNALEPHSTTAAWHGDTLTVH
ncbi:MAG TPA: xanthine dehydrogenase family protein molybdopterin-binding subunit, partial [Actinomycetes bacterium]|nr:xanthine dehydrogenase family protein molybdopterin-binding subunit [Actinomycetes bacterium]